MQIIETKVYTFDELSDEAKDKARYWYREDGFSYDWWDQVYEDAYAIAKLMGLDIEPCGRNDRTHGINFSGFSSQGDGACFAGRYRPVRGALAAVKEYAPQDEMLHSIAAELDSIQDTCGHILSVLVGHRGNYCHSHSMTFDHWFDTEQDGLETIGLEARVEAALRDFADWIYEQLEELWDDINSDESVGETILANEYTFEASGSRFG